MNDPAISEELCVLECWEEMTMKKYHRNRTMTQNKSDHFRIFTPTRLAMSIVTALFIGMVLRPASTMAQDYFDPQAL